ncbi:Fe(3+)-hydroxamate ABC transporter permease FhuB [Erwinia mallotivora]|uniref:Iron ABC transporter n=1 Tax=Erwinia mallotivora TaxID=69222 RepID=A0A014NA13_9GAMM|nr:Fe(3+)-hydroxamate ABC transporter permease FhuB [Erwinia mallotivora]EXU76203.1 iron ABC transporter [Erwinia mallotivora]
MRSATAAGILLFCFAAALACVAFNYFALMARYPSSLATLLLDQSFLPRVLVSLLCGAGLALAGLLFQQVLQNPLAEPGTLGVAAGANLAMSAALVFAPGLLALGLPVLALSGSAIAVLLLMKLTAGHRFAPLSVILVGMVLSLYGNALNTLLVLFNHDYLSDLFSWQAGALPQSGWRSSIVLALALCSALIFSLLLVRPLAVLSLSEQQASALGISVLKVRIATLSVAVVLSAIITSEVGIISFIGLAAPAIVRASGIRRFLHQLIATVLTGAVMLTLVDQLALRFSPAAGDIPTGAVTALLSAPLLLVLLLRQRVTGSPVVQPAAPAVTRFNTRQLGILLLLLALALPASLWLNREPPGALTSHLLAWRWPRMTGALCAGVMLACAGVLIQRLTGNVMASPELTGISSGAVLAVLLTVLFTPLPMAAMLPSAIAGSIIAMLLLLVFGARSRFNPQKVVLIGLSLTSLAGALNMLLMLSGDPRALMLLNWSTGSTAGINAEMAIEALIAAVVLCPLALLMQRWLQLLGLGQLTAQSLGIHLSRTNLLVLLLISLLTAAGTLLVGPLSFIGLLAPQCARSLGVRALRHQLCAAAPIGGTLMVLADWLGRNIAWPWPVSAGLLTAFIGAPWFLWQFSRTVSR